MKKVGLIGTGAIGKGVLKNLIKNNCDVLAYDISEKAKENIRNLGGFVANHPKEVIQFSEIVFLSLPSPQIIKDLFLGTEGIAKEMKSHTTILDLSTIDPATAREMNDLCHQYNSHYFDCPVSGGPAGADEGTLTIMVGGDKDQFDNIVEYLGYIGSNIEYIGESGLAQVLKLCHNMIGAANIVALGEAFATGVKHGLSVKVMANVIGKSLAGSRPLEYFGPNIVNNTYDNVKFMLNHMHKDLGLYVNMTRQVGIPSFIGTNTYNLYNAAKTHNKGSLDHTAVCQIIEDLASVKLVENNHLKNEVEGVMVGSKKRTNEVKKIGLIGVGAIGEGVLKNLIKNNCEVLAYDISEKGKAKIRNLGGLVANHPKEVVQFSEIVFLSLPSPQIIKDLFLGTEGIAKEMKSHTTILDLSTIDPATAREMNDLCKQYNSHYFDCPVSGGPAGADEGTLTIMVGGDSEQFVNIIEDLGYIGTNIEYIGESGIAQALKLCHNMVGAASIVALGEAFATGVKHGLDVKVMADVIGKSVSNSKVLQYFGPNIINNTYDNVKFMLNHAHKDLGLYVNMTQDVGVPSFIGASTYNLFHIAKIHNKGSLDQTAVCQVIEDFSSVKLVENSIPNK
ncbi:NAD(P)-dependent oxidoreductase [Peribacillus aracenensis]|uniref:NAD(P)-dependent oxidoreductase n=1 Tax=Peribacillus aracenensis TaxID=2976708 RepID=UPI0021A84DFE|nr:NAD(P)-dependent oxidoreductase [Peribacillus sp. BBB004]